MSVIESRGYFGEIDNSGPHEISRKTQKQEEGILP